MDEKFKNIRDQKAFKAPDGYFEALEDRILERIPLKSKQPKESWIDQLVYQLHLRFSVPLISALSLVAAVLYISLEIQPVSPLVLNDAEIADYLTEEYDEDLISEYLLSEGVQTKNTITDDEIILYLSEEYSEEELLEFVPEEFN